MSTASSTRKIREPFQLTDQKEIAIVIGRPPKEIPSKGDFSGA